MILFVGVALVAVSLVLWVAFPITRTAWYVPAEHPYHRSHHHHVDRS